MAVTSPALRKRLPPCRATSIAPSPALQPATIDGEFKIGRIGRKDDARSRWEVVPSLARRTATTNRAFGERAGSVALRFTIHTIIFDLWVESLMPSPMMRSKMPAACSGCLYSLRRAVMGSSRLAR